MINELIKLSDELDKRSLVREADYLDALIRKVALDPQIHPVQTVYATGQFQGIEVGTFQENGPTGQGEDVYEPNQFGLAVGYEKGSQIPPQTMLKTSVAPEQYQRFDQHPAPGRPAFRDDWIQDTPPE